MKLRQIAAGLILSSALAVAFFGCDLLKTPVSIDQRITSFFANLNNSDRSNVYNDFHPDQTISYNALKNPVALAFNTAYPPPIAAAYSYSILDESNPSAGVHVRVLTGPISGSGHAPASLYLLLTMATYNGVDWRIVTLSDSGSDSGYTPIFQ